MDSTVALEHIDSSAKGVWCFDFADIVRAKCRGTIGKPDVDGIILEECISWATLSFTDSTTGVLLETCFSKVLQDLKADQYWRKSPWLPRYSVERSRPPTR